MNHTHTKLKRPSLNHTYRLVWSDAKQMFIPVAEGSASKGKSHVALSLATVLLGCSLNAYAIDSSALPTGANISHGSAAITQSGNTLTIQQNSDKLITNWNTFNIGENATVNFVQPSATSAALNRVLDNNPSQILGHLNSNGQVYLINPNGIVFGQNAQVDVGGLIASTLNISDDDFLNNKLQFSKTDLNNGTLKNLGYIKAHGGIVALIGQQVDNQGTVLSNQGNVALAAGDQVTLDFSGDGLMKVSVDKGVVDALVHNGGLVQADGGLVVMTTQARNDIYKNLINNDGIVQAQTLASKDGKILLLGGMTNGTVTAAGTLDASAPTTGDGGFIETSAATVKAQPDLKVTTQAQNGKTGTWLIDPRDYTIAASGGNMTGALSSSILATSNMYIQSTSGSNPSGNGDIFVNDTITWNSGNSLQLIAQRNITINSTINASAGSGGNLYLKYGQGSVAAGNTATYSINAPINLQTGFNFWTLQGSDGALTGWRVITALGAAGSTTGKDLQGINGGLTGLYVLGANIDASATSSWNSGKGFTPIGDSTTGFSGKFDGLGHTISNLKINDSTNYKGLFGNLDGATVRNLGLNSFSISGQSGVGTLAGQALNSTISHIHIVSGSVTGTGGTSPHDIGGLIGYAGSGTSISQVYTSDASQPPISVSGSTYVGGLVGATNTASISECNIYASVDGNTSVGGLVGQSSGGSITNSYTYGSVYGRTSTIGGFIGSTSTGLTISNSYSKASVSSKGSAINVGAFVGISNGTNNITNSFWNTTNNSSLPGVGHYNGGGQPTLIGTTSTEMQNPFKFIDAGWDFNNIWGFLGSKLVLKAFSDTSYKYYVRIGNTTGATQTYGDTNITSLPTDGIGNSNVSATIVSGTNTGQYAFNDTSVVKLHFSTGTSADYYLAYGTSKLTIKPKPSPVTSTTKPSADKNPTLDPSHNQQNVFKPANLSNLTANTPAPEQRINQLAGTESLNNLANNHLWNDQRQHQTIVSISGKTWSVSFMQVGHQVMLMNPQNEPFSSADLPEVLEQSNYQDTDHAKKVVFQLTDKAGKSINVITHITSDGKAIIDVPTQLGNTFKKEELSLISLEALKQLGVDVSKISQIILNKVVI